MVHAFIFIIDFFFLQNSLRFTVKLSRRNKDYPYTHTPHMHTCIAFPIISIPSAGLHLLQWMKLHWHIIITQRSQLLKVFYMHLFAIYLSSLGKCLFMSFAHYMFSWGFLHTQLCHLNNELCFFLFNLCASFFACCTS